MDFGLPASAHNRQGGGTTVGGDGTFWNGIVDKDAIPSSSVDSKLEPIKRRIIGFASPIWQWLRPDVPGSISISFRELRKFRLFLLSIGGFATFFWIWAIYNTAHMKEGQDLGIYSFATVIISSLVGLIKAKPNGSFDKKICICMTASHVLVTLNYLLGVAFAFSAGTVIYWRFGIYCITFSILWGYAAYQGWKLGVLVVDLIDSTVEAIDEEARLVF